MTTEGEDRYAEIQTMIAEARYADAMTALQQLVAEHDGFAIAYNDLGVLYYQIGDKKKSVQCYAQAVSIEPENPNFRKNLADFYLVEQGRMEEALEIYLSVLKDNPEDIEVLMVAGHVCSAMGKQSSARTFYERVLDLEPWNFDANERLEQLEMEEP